MQWSVHTINLGIYFLIKNLLSAPPLSPPASSECCPYSKKGDFAFSAWLEGHNQVLPTEALTPQPWGWVLLKISCAVRWKMEKSCSSFWSRASGFASHSPLSLIQAWALQEGEVGHVENGFACSEERFCSRSRCMLGGACLHRDILGALCLLLTGRSGTCCCYWNLNRTTMLPASRRGCCSG